MGEFNRLRLINSIGYLHHDEEVGKPIIYLKDDSLNKFVGFMYSDNKFIVHKCCDNIHVDNRFIIADFINPLVKKIIE